MKLYLKYFKLTVEQAFKDVRKALKVLPGLTILLIGLLYFIVIMINVHPKDTNTLNEKYLGMLYIYVVTSFIYFLIFIYSSINLNPPTLGFRSSDANFLMPAPINKFNAYIFVIMKHSIQMLGFSVFMFSTQSSGIILLTGNILSVIIGMITLLLSFYTVNLLNYLFIYKLKYPKRIVFGLIVGILSFVGICVLAYQQAGLALFAIDWLHYIPFVGWNISMAYHSVMANYTMVIVYVGVYVVTIVALYHICKRVDVDYYEYELSRVAKTDKAYERQMGKKSTDDLKLFRKSNIEIKHTNSQVLIDFARLVGGKYWFISLNNIMNILFIAGGMFFLAFTTNGDIDGWIVSMVVVIANRLYFSTFVLNYTGLFNDFYLKLLPIKTIYKVLYYNFISFLNALLNAVIFSLVMLVNCIIFDYSLINILYTFVVTILICTTEILLKDTIGQYMANIIGKTLTIVIKAIISIVLFVVLFIGSFLLLNATSQPMLTFAYMSVVLLLLIALMLYISIRIYDRFDMSEYNSNQ